MYLSKVEIRNDAIRNPYQLHKKLWSLFPDTPDQERDFLFRIEIRQYGKTVILMQSNRKPEPAVSGGVLLAATKPFNPRFSDGQVLRFYLMANPIKTIKDEQGRINKRGQVKSCRVFLINEAEQQAWLARKLEGAARTLSLDIQKLPPIFFRKNKENRPGKIQPAGFHGVLRVEDAGCFYSMIQAGIGPAKSFGCGMMSLAKA